MKRWLSNLRHGRAQRTLAATTALSALPLGVEIYLEHFRGSFGDRWMWTPVALSPALAAAGCAAFGSPRAARTVLPAVSALYLLDGLVGVYSHPWAWNEIGFGGPAYPRGYARLGAGQREHWESPPEFAVDPVGDVRDRELE